MDYASPGDAFSSQLERALLQREAVKQQAFQNQLAVQREQRQSIHDQMEADQAREALAEKRRAFDESQTDKRKASFEKSVSTMMPGDIASPDMLEQAHQFGLSHLFPAEMDAVVKAAPAPAGIAADPEEVLPPMPQATPEAPLPQKFIGTPGQRKEASDDAAILDLAKTLPAGSPERMALEYEAHTGKNAPAGMFKGPSSDGTPVARVDPKRQVVQRLVNGQWVDVGGDVPKGTHFLQEPDTSARDAAATAAATAKTDRDARDLQGVREHGYTEFNALSKGPETQLGEFEKVGAALNQRTAQADAELSVMFLKAVAGGYGSGLRMTKTEIENTLHGSTKWENLERVMNAYSNDPQKAPIPEEQRQAMRQLAQALREKAHKAADRVNKARIALDNAKTVAEANKVRSQIHTDLNPEESELNNDPSKGAGGKPRIVYDSNLKPVKQ